MSVKEVISSIESHGGVIIPSRLDITPHRMRALHELVESHGFHVFDLLTRITLSISKNTGHLENLLFFLSNANALGQIGTRAIGTRLADRGFSAIESVGLRKKSKLNRSMLLLD